MISVIIPTLNAAPTLPHTLAPLVAGVADGLVKQAIIADGGSHDDTCAIAQAAGCGVVLSAAGHATQMQAGVAAAKGRWFLFLTPQTMLEESWLEAAHRFIALGDGRAAAFRFATTATGVGAQMTALAARLGEVMKRPRIEQGLLISRALYKNVGGYREGPDAHADLIRRIGGARLVILSAKAIYGAGVAPEATPPTRVSSGV